MSAIGLPTDEYEKDYVLIDEVLLKMRNKIAHGDNLESLSLDEDRFNEIYSKIFRLIEYFSTQISNAASLKQYLKTNESYWYFAWVVVDCSPYTTHKQQINAKAL